mmetsp:Transcript_32837/g.78577  ORF Transcript_32837/g.78577 Transcript_32837/m.78577 type:complete len:256 (+) Transcript_32837:174-941(+)
MAPSLVQASLLSEGHFDCPVAAVHQLQILGTLKSARWKEISELSCMFLDDPFALCLDHRLPLMLILLQSLHLLTLLLPGHLIGLAPDLQQPLGLPLVRLQLQAPLVIVELLEPVVLCKLLHHLCSELLLLRASLCQLLILGPLLHLAGHLELLPILQDLPRTLLLLAPALGFELLEVKLVAEILEHLLLFALGLHLPNHLVHESLLFQLTLFLFCRELLLLLTLHPCIGLNALVLLLLLCKLLDLSLLLLHEEVL